ncbi:cyclic nucleotide-binding domain-containing protein [Paenibacillus sp. FSL R7-0048]|uniref:cyclic nucleotide-binding domain-containing protein n=1 Tax=Paenibacillus TaxID=44249 RepID=UPI0009D75E8E|nr:cyclic nucleotide-binding domain-containing protein [Paenibacillus odorifer]
MISKAAVDFLRDHPFLRGIPDDELQNVINAITLVSLEDGQRLLMEASTSKDCFILWQGKVQVTSVNLVGKTLLLAELGPGELVGEMGLIRNEQRSASVTAIGPVKALRLDRPSFQYLANLSPLFYESVLVNIRIRMIHSMLRKATIWSVIPDAELRGLAEITTIKKVTKGEEIIVEGAVIDHFFMINSGSIELRGQKRRKTVLREGDFYGETELLTDTAASHALIAVEDSELLIMGKLEFLTILDYYAPVRQQLIKVLNIRTPHLLEKVTIAIGEESIAEDKESLPKTKDKWIDQLLWLVGGFLVVSFLALFLHSQWWKIATLIVGGVVGPAAFVAFVRSQQLIGFRQRRLVLVFVSTAVVAIPLAWYLERIWLFEVKANSFDFSQLYVPLSVALIEETAKLLICVMLVRTRKIQFLMDAVVFGAAAGMGFAAVESIIYGWVHLDEASSIGMLTVLWMRALLSPFGHGTWTAIATVGIWYASSMHKNSSLGDVKPWTRWRRAIEMFLVVVVMHALWNYHFESGLMKAGVMAVVGIMGLFLLFLLIRRGRREEFHALNMLNPTMNEAIRHDEQVKPMMQELYCEGCGSMSPPGTRYCTRCSQALRIK